MGDLTLPNVSLRVEVEPSGGSVVVSVDGGAAAYVVLTSPLEGRFDSNGFFLRPGHPRQVSFLPLVPDGVAQKLNQSSVRVEHLAQHLQPLDGHANRHHETVKRSRAGSRPFMAGTVLQPAAEDARGPPPVGHGLWSSR